MSVMSFMGREEEYREKAREAERDAQFLSRRDEREAMLSIAKSWHELADMEAAKPAAPEG